MTAPLVTLFADASWCPETRLGAWAAWWKIDGPAFTHSGVFRAAVPDSTTAEACALANGLHLLAGRHDLPRGTRIIAQTDCLGAIRILNGEPLRRMPSQAVAARSLVEGITRLQQLRVQWRHVPGHQGGRTRRSWVNEWCDTTARALLRQARTGAALPQHQHNPKQELHA
ncbi:hypothetical protein KTR66_09770 [Roseococcus sp. SDR]|uniref:RNase H family protein n=1 Tax=Roseococcus sp. SDR TaxID=2835532 RepID=UPI001BCD6A78|nr:RNase H family protein [Roseococcus sp. SDR]MBS7790284.1 hypothetical protein [Roseococcus sp. SDR]MBV1845598.1 hypothetical protein [Roseococcus sp. SDR]